MFGNSEEGGGKRKEVNVTAQGQRRAAFLHGSLKSGSLVIALTSGGGPYLPLSAALRSCSDPVLP